MVTLLHTTMSVRRNLDLDTQGAQAAIGQEGCNGPIYSISMQVLLTDTLCLLFFSLTVTSLLFLTKAHIPYMLCDWLMTVIIHDWLTTGR